MRDLYRVQKGQSSETEDLNNTNNKHFLMNVLRVSELITTGMNSFEALIGHLQKPTIFWAIKQDSTDFEGLKSLGVCSDCDGSKPEIKPRKRN